LRFDDVELLPGVAVAWLPLEDGAVHPISPDQLLNLVDATAAG
jgi:hypothetical protein